MERAISETPPRRRAKDRQSDRGTDPNRTTDPSRSSAHDAEPNDGIDQQTAAAAPLDGREPDAIARRAYELYVARGGSDGQDLDDWLQAEREINARRRGGV
jgi:hypothetical protein